MKNSELLRKAKAIYLYCDRPEKVDFICHAIDRTYANQMQKRHLKEWILDLLGGVNCLEVWLSINYKIDLAYAGSYEAYSAKKRVTREAWLDWMIAYWEEQEKRDAQV